MSKEREIDIVDIGYIRDQDGRKRTRVKYDDGTEWLPTLTEISELMIKMGECIKKNEARKEKEKNGM